MQHSTKYNMQRGMQHTHHACLATCHAAHRATYHATYCAACHSTHVPYLSVVALEDEVKVQQLRELCRKLRRRAVPCAPSHEALDNAAGPELGDRRVETERNFVGVHGIEALDVLGDLGTTALSVAVLEKTAEGHPHVCGMVPLGETDFTSLELLEEGHVGQRRRGRGRYWTHSLADAV